MSDPWRTGRVGVAVLGAFYGVPLVVAGLVVRGVLGTLLAGAGVALSCVAVVRGARVDLRRENGRLIVRNRWRVVSFEVDTRLRLEPVTPWWMLVTRTATVNILGVRRAGHRLAVPALATLGKDPNDPEIAAVVGDLAPSSAPARSD